MKDVVTLSADTILDSKTVENLWVFLACFFWSIAHTDR